jgi:hypothetical protein
MTRGGGCITSCIKPSIKNSIFNSTAENVSNNSKVQTQAQTNNVNTKTPLTDLKLVAIQEFLSFTYKERDVKSIVFLKKDTDSGFLKFSNYCLQKYSHIKNLAIFFAYNKNVNFLPISITKTRQVLNSNTGVTLKQLNADIVKLITTQSPSPSEQILIRFLYDNGAISHEYSSSDTTLNLEQRGIFETTVRAVGSAPDLVLPLTEALIAHRYNLVSALLRHFPPNRDDTVGINSLVEIIRNLGGQNPLPDQISFALGVWPPRNIMFKILDFWIMNTEENMLNLWAWRLRLSPTRQEEIMLYAYITERWPTLVLEGNINSSNVAYADKNYSKNKYSVPDILSLDEYDHNTYLCFNTNINKFPLFKIQTYVNASSINEPIINEPSIINEPIINTSNPYPNDLSAMLGKYLNTYNKPMVNLLRAYMNDSKDINSNTLQCFFNHNLSFVKNVGYKKGKKSIACFHAEFIGFFLGMINAPPEKPINLRVPSNLVVYSGGVDMIDRHGSSMSTKEIGSETYLLTYLSTSTNYKTAISFSRGVVFRILITNRVQQILAVSTMFNYENNSSNVNSNSENSGSDNANAYFFKEYKDPDKTESEIILPIGSVLKLIKKYPITSDVQYDFELLPYNIKALGILHTLFESACCDCAQTKPFSGGSIRKKYDREDAPIHMFTSLEDIELMEIRINLDFLVSANIQVDDLSGILSRKYTKFKSRDTQKPGLYKKDFMNTASPLFAYNLPGDKSDVGYYDFTEFLEKTKTPARNRIDNTSNATIALNGIPIKSDETIALMFFNQDNSLFKYKKFIHFKIYKEIVELDKKFDVESNKKRIEILMRIKKTVTYKETDNLQKFFHEVKYRKLINSFYS